MGASPHETTPATPASHTATLTRRRRRTGLTSQDFLIVTSPPTRKRCSF